MEFRVLKYFLMTAREENITRAANILHITQPSLSRQIKQLEDELGVKLFNRHKHSISLTEDGMLLKRRAQEIVSLAEKTQLEITHKDGHLAGEIVIGCGEMKSIKFLSRFFNEFTTKYPQVRLDIHTAMADDIKERIENGLSDIGLLTEPVDINKYEFCRLPTKDRWGVFVHRESHQAALEFIQPPDLINMPLIIPKRQLVQNEILNWFGEYRDKMEILGTYNLLYNAAALANSSGGGVICIDLFQKLDDLIFVPLAPSLETGSVLVWKKYQILPPVTAQFIQSFKQYLKNIDAYTR